MNEHAAVPISQALLDDLYTLRLIVFLEDQPLSNKYRQVLLTPEQFKVVSLSLGKLPQVLDHLSSAVYELPDVQQIV